MFHGTILALAAVLAIEAGAKPDQDSVLAEIARLGGKVSVEERAPGKPALRANLCYMRNVAQVLPRLRSLDNLVFVSLWGSPVTDADLVHLKDLPNLEVVCLWDTGVSDEGLRHLKNLPRLRELYLGRSMVSIPGTNQVAISDVGLKHLSEMKHLRILDINHCKISDRGIAELTTLPHLSHIDVSSTEVTEKVIPTLKGFKQLTGVNLFYTTLSGTGKSREALQPSDQEKSPWLPRPRIAMECIPPAQLEELRKTGRPGWDLPYSLRKSAVDKLLQAEEVEVYSLDPEKANAADEVGKPKKDKFHEYLVLGKTKVINQESRRKVVELLKQGISQSVPAMQALCFQPRHGIRFKSQAMPVDVLICFECYEVKIIFLEDGPMGGAVRTEIWPEKYYDLLLAGAGIPLAPKTRQIPIRGQNGPDPKP
jgi:hypothetical protein